MSTHFILQPYTLASDPIRISYAYTRLEGAAAKWFFTLKQSYPNSEIHHDLAQF